MNVSKQNEDKKFYKKKDLVDMFAHIPKITENLLIDNNTKNIYNKKSADMDTVKQKNINDAHIVQ